MITKDTTSTVNFYVTDIDGLPVTGKASSISAAISVNGGQATAISDTITEIDSTNLPGWYRLNHHFSTAGNVFITFSCTGCNIAPWEENVVEIPTAAAIGAAVDVSSALTSYGAAKASDIPTAAEIGTAALETSVAAVEGTAAELSLASLILAQFNSRIDTNGVWTIYQTDGTTVKTQRQVITTEYAEPVTGIENV